jgi:hypothetical protein
MHKCFTPCIFYNEIFKNPDKTEVKIVCNFHDKEIQNIPEEDIVKCQHFSTYQDLRNKRKF